jgi:glycosyltransferase involved in cell wall biosynthesis
VRPVDPRVSVGLPVRNGERYLAGAVRSVLEQSDGRLELVISDNASDDGTEEICRGFARSDARVRYHRQPRDIGLVENFEVVLHRARGTYFTWLGDDDWLTPTYVSRCAGALDDDPALILVTTQQAHVRADGVVETARYDGGPLRSPSPVDRFEEMLRLLNESHLLLDPLYGMMRRAPLAWLPRPVMLFEDQILAARLALAGPFGHVPEVLSYRRARPFPRLAATADKLGVPRWQARMATALQCRELLAAVQEARLSPYERRRARVAVGRMFLRRRQVTATRRARQLLALVGHPVRFSPSSGALQQGFSSAGDSGAHG